MSVAAEASFDCLLLADRLRQGVLRVNRQLRRETQRLGASPIVTILLAMIARQPGIGVTELAQQEGMRTPTMSGHVKRLEEEGLVRRTAPGRADRRRIGIVLTEDGERLLEDIRRRRTDWLAGRLAALDPGALAVLEAAVPALLRLGE